MRQRLAPLLVAAWLGLGAPGCDDQSYREIGGEIGVLNKRSDALVITATSRLRAHGRRAIPQIETALHTASESGRRNLIGALEAIGDPEAIPILRHFAVYDLAPSVQAACETVLQAWSTGSDARAEAARAALTRVKEMRGAGEGPAPIRPTAL